MPRLTRIYTRTGDDGSTGLGTSRRVGKESLRVEAYGTLDELNCQVGFALSLGLGTEVAVELQRIQHELFNAGSDLAVPEEDKANLPVPVLEERHVVAIEAWIDRMLAELPPLENFMLPGGSPTSAAPARRAHRLPAGRDGALVALARREPVGAWAMPYLNRLSDLLFVYARAANLLTGDRDRAVELPRLSEAGQPLAMQAGQLRSRRRSRSSTTARLKRSGLSGFGLALGAVGGDVDQLEVHADGAEQARQALARQPARGAGRRCRRSASAPRRSPPGCRRCRRARSSAGRWSRGRCGASSGPRAG